MKYVLTFEHRRNPKNFGFYSLLLLFTLIYFLVVISFLKSILLFQAAAFICGWVTWTYGEYYWHRFLMHARGKTIAAGAQGNHLYHHQHPTELRIKTLHRVLMSMIFLLLIILSAVLQNYITFFTGLFFGFILYCYVHVLLHHQWSSKLFPRLLRYHVHHHCKYPNLCFGVSVPWWDDFFRTVPPNGIVIPIRILEFYFRKPEDLS